MVANQLGEIGQVAVQLGRPSDPNALVMRSNSTGSMMQLWHQLVEQGGKYHSGMDTAQIIEAIDTEIQRLQAARALLGSPTSKPAAKPLTKKPGKRKISADGRARIVAAQKARWAKVKARR